MANELNAKGILVFTRQGYMARCTSWLRPKSTPIYAFTNKEHVQNQLCLQWGILPFLIEFSNDPETTILRAEKVLRESGLLMMGDQIVVITDVLARDKLINTVQMRAVE
jgi:pyruvate kinase